MKVLITGAAGQLARCILDRISPEWTVLALSSSELDVSDYDQVHSVVSRLNPDIIINTAAYTAVDKAEGEPEKAANVNTNGPKFLAEAAAEHNARLYHISTDYVFDGKSKTPYIEDDKTNPLSAYGKTKLEGELAVLTANPQAIIIRTAWVFSEYGNNFVKTMLRLGRERSELNVINDQCGCPTYAGDLADAILTLIEKDRAQPGVYHFCGDSMTTWYGFAEAIFAEAAKQPAISVNPKLNPILTEQYPTPATRPFYSVLDCKKIEAMGIKRSDWRGQLKNVINKIVAGGR